MAASPRNRIRTFSACSLCAGSGQDPMTPQRRATNGEMIFLVKPCPVCEGRGVVPSVQASPTTPSASGVRARPMRKSAPAQGLVLVP